VHERPQLLHDAGVTVAVTLVVVVFIVVFFL